MQVQHFMLVGVSLPFLAIHQSTAPWATLDYLATFVAAAGASLFFPRGGVSSGPTAVGGRR